MQYPVHGSTTYLTTTSSHWIYCIEIKKLRVSRLTSYIFIPLCLLLGGDYLFPTIHLSYMLCCMSQWSLYLFLTTYHFFNYPSSSRLVSKLKSILPFMITSQRQIIGPVLRAASSVTSQTEFTVLAEKTRIGCTQSR